MNACLGRKLALMLPRELGRKGVLSLRGIVTGATPAAARTEIFGDLYPFSFVPYIGQLASVAIVEPHACRVDW